MFSACHVTRSHAPRQMADDAPQPPPAVEEETAAPEAPAAGGEPTEAPANVAAADAPQSVPPPSDASAPSPEEGEPAPQQPPAPAPAPEPSEDTDRSDESRRRNAARRSRSRSPRGRSRSRSRSRSPPRRQRRGKASGWDVSTEPPVVVAPTATAQGIPGAVAGVAGAVSAVVQGGAKHGKLAAHVQSKVNELIASGKVGATELDALVLQKLAGAKEEVAMEALTQFSVSDLGKVKNKSGFLSSVIKRVDMERIAALSRGNPAMAHQHHAAMAQQQQGRGQQAAGYTPYPQMYPQGAPRYPGATPVMAPGPFGALDAVVRGKLEEMIRQGVLAPTDLDARALETMREAGQAAALYALDRLAKSDTSHVRNRVGFLMSACVNGCSCVFLQLAV